MVGHTTGDWAGTRVIRLDEVSDFAAMAMDDEGLRLWLYQVKTLRLLYCLVGGHCNNLC